MALFKKNTPETLIRDWLRDHPQDAVRVGIDWLILDGADWEPIFWDELGDYVGDAEAFLAGEGRHLNRNDAWLVIRDGGFTTMSDQELVRRMTALWRNRRYCDAIMRGELSVPPEMAEFIGLPPKAGGRRRWPWPSTPRPTPTRRRGPPWTSSPSRAGP